MKYACLLSALLGSVLTFCSCVSLQPTPENALGVLQEQLANGIKWKRIHAAEALLDSQCCIAEVAQEFAAESKLTEPDTPWRVGVMRVLMQTNPPQRQAMADELWQMARNPEAEGRIHAIESLGKLKLPLQEADSTWLQELRNVPGMTSGYAALLLAQNGDVAARKLLAARLTANDNTAAFAFFYLEDLSNEEKSLLVAVADSAEATPTCRAFAFRALMRSENYPQSRHAEMLQRIATEEDAGALRFYLLTVGMFKDKSDLLMLAKYLNHRDPALKIAAAASILAVTK